MATKSKITDKEHVIEYVLTVFAGWEVKHNPRGRGHVIAIPVTLGSTVKSYYGNFSTPIKAQAEINRQRQAMIDKGLAEGIDAIKPQDKAASSEDSQLKFL